MFINMLCSKVLQQLTSAGLQPPCSLQKPEPVKGLPGIMAAAIGRDIESIYNGNNKGILADVDLLQRITEACRWVTVGINWMSVNLHSIAYLWGTFCLKPCKACRCSSHLSGAVC